MLHIGALNVDVGNFVVLQFGMIKIHADTRAGAAPEQRDPPRFALQNRLGFFQQGEGIIVVVVGAGPVSGFETPGIPLLLRRRSEVAVKYRNLAKEVEMFEKEPPSAQTGLTETNEETS